MIDGKVVVGLIAFIAIVVAIAYFMTPSMSRFHDDDYGSWRGDCGSFNGCDSRDLRRAAAEAEARALREAAAVHEAKRHAAEYREAAAERDMRREESIKLVAEAEARSLQRAAARHEQASRMQADMANRAMTIASNAGLAANSYDALKMQQMELARSERGLVRQNMLNSAFAEPGCRRL